MAVLDDLAGGRLPIGVSLAVIATTVIASILLSLLLPRTARIPEGDRPGRIVRVAIGSVFVVLCGACLAIVAGIRPPFLSSALEVVKIEWLCISGLCYAVCGWLLLHSTGR